jgi:hypothetical protein
MGVCGQVRSASRCPTHLLPTLLCGSPPAFGLWGLASGVISPLLCTGRARLPHRAPSHGVSAVRTTWLCCWTVRLARSCVGLRITPEGLPAGEKYLKPPTVNDHTITSAISAGTEGPIPYVHDPIALTRLTSFAPHLSPGLPRSLRRKSRFPNVLAMPDCSGQCF